MLITIRDAYASAVIDSLGAQLISYKDAAGQEYIWQRDPDYWPRCSPLLFPIVGNLRNDSTIIEGQTYRMAKHGFCRDIDFTVTDTADHSAAFETDHTDETLAIYPYAFHLSMTYTMSDGRLTISYDVKNTDQKTIYYCLGAHPGFHCPMKDGEVFDDYVLRFEQDETASSIIYDADKLQFNPAHTCSQLEHSRILPLSRELFRNDAVYFDSLKSREVSLIHGVTGKGISVSYPDFETIAFWSPYLTHAPFVCIEPWNGSAVYATEDDEFIHKNHVQSLNMGESRTYLLSIKAIS